MTGLNIISDYFPEPIIVDSLIFFNALTIKTITPNPKAPPPRYVKIWAVSNIPGIYTKNALKRKTGTPKL